MIYLYTLPGTAFNCPQISIPLLKGYLKNSGITSKQYDLSATFLEKCFTKNYIKRLSLKYYNSLNENEKDIIENIENSIKELKCKYVDTSKIVSANYQVLQYLNIIGNFYNVKWKRRGIDFSKKISTIDDVIELAFDKNNSLFDRALVNEQDLRDGDIIYLSIQYPFQLNYAIRFSKYLKSQNRKLHRNAITVREHFPYVMAFLFLYSPILKFALILTLLPVSESLHKLLLRS